MTGPNISTRVEHTDSGFARIAFAIVLFRIPSKKYMVDTLRTHWPYNGLTPHCHWLPTGHVEQSVVTLGCTCVYDGVSEYPVQATAALRPRISNSYGPERTLDTGRRAEARAPRSGDPKISV